MLFQLHAYSSRHSEHTLEGFTKRWVEQVCPPLSLEYGRALEGMPQSLGQMRVCLEAALGALLPIFTSPCPAPTCSMALAYLQ